jgi:hypothetical protein
MEFGAMGANFRNGVSKHCNSSIPFYADFSRRDNHISLGAPVFDNIAQNGHILLAISGNFFLLAGPPPSYGLDAIAAFSRAKSVLRKLVQLHAMSELLVQIFEHIEGAFAGGCYWGVATQDFEVKTIAIECDHACEIFEFGDQFQCVILKPMPKAGVLIPSDRDRETKRANIAPAAIHFVRQADRFDIQVNFPIE